MLGHPGLPGRHALSFPGPAIRLGQRVPCRELLAVLAAEEDGEISIAHMFFLLTQKILSSDSAMHRSRPPPPERPAGNRPFPAPDEFRSLHCWNPGTSSPR